MDFEVFLDFVSQTTFIFKFLLCQFHDPYLEKAVSENVIKLNTLSVFFKVKGHINAPSWKG